MGGTYRRSRTRTVVPKDQEGLFAGILRLRCRDCTICIGPGFDCDEIYYDPERKRYLCHRCSDRAPDGPGYLLINRIELAEIPGGKPFLALLKGRVIDLTQRLADNHDGGSSWEHRRH